MKKTDKIAEFSKQDRHCINRIADILVKGLLRADFGSRRLPVDDKNNSSQLPRKRSCNHSESAASSIQE